MLLIYLEDRGARQADPKKLAARIGRLNEFWGGRRLSEINGATCRQFASERGTSGARRELEDLRAAIRYHRKEGFHRGEIVVTLPERGSPRERWLTRSEAALLLWTCWRHREVQRGTATRKRPWRHIARFVLIGVYTGTRAGAIASASPTRAEGRSYVDLDNGVFYRLAQGRRATKKRQPPVPIPPRLLAHMRRWKRLDIASEHFVEFNGKPIKSVKTALASASRLAGLKGVSPHVFRHTAATWLMQAGCPIWEAAGYLGMTVEMLQKVYGHHHVDYMQGAVAAFRNPRKSLVQPLARIGDIKQ